MRVIFLDVDGVLNSTRYNRGAGHGAVFGPDQIDPEAVELLNKIVEATDASIVISSSWRDTYDIDQMAELLASRGFEFPEKVISETPKDYARGFRGHEIQQWLDLYRERRIIDPDAEPVTSYVILDDSTDFTTDQQLNFVHTPFIHGLMPHHVEKAIGILKRG